MPFSAALSTDLDTVQAIDEVCQAGLAELQAVPDLALLFFTPHHAETLTHEAAKLRQRIQTKSLLGCSGMGIIGDQHEVEQGPALALWLAHWEKPMTVEPFHLSFAQTAAGIQIHGFPGSIAKADPKDSALLLLSDPATFQMQPFLSVVNQQFPGLRVLGGLASGASAVGRSPLLLGDEMRFGGAIGVLLSGPNAIRSVVSQGGRPIGKRLAITQGRANVITELDGRPPAEKLREIRDQLSPEEMRFFDQGVYLGRFVKKSPQESGELLLRGCDVDRAVGSLKMEDRITLGEEVQFILRDPASADDEMRRLLQTELAKSEQKPGGALLFTCNRRGTRFFAQPNHDAGLLGDVADDLPVAGFFAEGEIGPVGGLNFTHGYTATVVLFDD